MDTAGGTIFPAGFYFRNGRSGAGYNGTILNDSVDLSNYLAFL
jgi:hypothetical protein